MRHSKPKSKKKSSKSLLGFLFRLAKVVISYAALISVGELLMRSQVKRDLELGPDGVFRKYGDDITGCADPCCRLPSHALYRLWHPSDPARMGTPDTSTPSGFGHDGATSGVWPGFPLDGQFAGHVADALDEQAREGDLVRSAPGGEGYDKTAATSKQDEAGLPGFQVFRVVA
jgi:hypothetical protein